GCGCSGCASCCCSRNCSGSGGACCSCAGGRYPAGCGRRGSGRSARGARSAGRGWSRPRRCRSSASPCRTCRDWRRRRLGSEHCSGSCACRSGARDLADDDYGHRFSRRNPAPSPRAARQRGCSDSGPCQRGL
ncbi:MAG: hypothetical protein AVDCRST_MAG09-2012, partial [uncultured Sphingomonas sp.]